MTPYEKRQPERVFIDAGKKAYGMLIYQSSNPYKVNPWMMLWDKGYSSAKRKAECTDKPAARPTTGDKPKWHKVKPTFKGAR